MTVVRTSVRILVVLALSLLAAPAGAQQTAPSSFEPQVGQTGKDVVWVPSPQALVDKMLDLAKVTPADYLIDLGSGDGITVISAAKRGVRAHGIEYDPNMVALSKENAERANVSLRATFAKADIFESDFSQATVLTLFLLPSLNLKLQPTILGLKPGTRIVSNTFPMGDWEADEKFTVTDCDRWCTALLWIVPAKVEGAWSTAQGDLTLYQEFQMLSGTLGSGQISEGRLRGDEITFRIGEAQYVGRVTGGRMSGTSTLQGKSTDWTATRR